MATQTTHRGCNAPEWCGRWEFGSQQMCDELERQMLVKYPHGWRHYPGDICRHGVYVGGSGIDWMCGRCEMGE